FCFLWLAPVSRPFVGANPGSQPFLCPLDGATVARELCPVPVLLCASPRARGNLAEESGQPAGPAEARGGAQAHLARLAPLRNHPVLEPGEGSVHLFPILNVHEKSPNRIQPARSSERGGRAHPGRSHLCRRDACRCFPWRPSSTAACLGCRSHH